MDLSEGLLREVARVQHTKTLQLVRDQVENVHIPNAANMNDQDRAEGARRFKTSVISILQGLQEDHNE